MTDLNVKARVNTPTIFVTLNSPHIFFEKIQENFNIEYNLDRLKHYKYGVVHYSITEDYYIVLKKIKRLFMIIE